MITTSSEGRELKELKAKFSSMPQNSKVTLKSGSFINPIGDLLFSVIK